MRVPNPAHRRSSRFGLTTEERALVARMDRRDAKVVAALGRGLRAEDLATTMRALRLARERFEVRWKIALGRG